jgi:hypothetical protein
VLKTLLAKVTQKVMKAKAMVTVHFLETGQFMGFSGSVGPFQSTRFGSFPSVGGAGDSMGFPSPASGFSPFSRSRRARSSSPMREGLEVESLGAL